MILQWLVTGVSLLAALLAWRQARRTAQRLERLSQMYWELKFQHGELRIEVQRLGGNTDTQPDVRSPAADRPTDSFIPLTSLKR